MCSAPRGKTTYGGDAHERNDVACVCLTFVLLCPTVTMIKEGVHMERINVRVDERLKQELETEAREKGVRPRILSAKHWKNTCGRGRHPQLPRPRRRIGIIGSAKGLPTDLSTNPITWKASGLAERILIDTGPMVALLSEDDEHHPRCREALTILTLPS